MLCEQSWKKKEQAEQHNNTIPTIDMYPSAAIEVLWTQEDRAMQCTLEKSSLMTLAHYFEAIF